MYVHCAVMSGATLALLTCSVGREKSHPLFHRVHNTIQYTYPLKDVYLLKRLQRGVVVSAILRRSGDLPPPKPRPVTSVPLPFRCIKNIFCYIYFWIKIIIKVYKEIKGYILLSSLFVCLIWFCYVELSWYYGRNICITLKVGKLVVIFKANTYKNLSTKTIFAFRNSIQCGCSLPTPPNPEIVTPWNVFPIK